MTRLRIATFNLENLDTRPGKGPPLAARIAVLRPQLLKLDADILCLQEVNGQKSTPHGSRALAALDALLAGTPYAAFARVVSKRPGGKGPADIQNTAILSRLPVVACDQLWHDLVPPLSYRVATVDAEIETRFDRPILHAAVALPNGRRLHVLNLHLKAPLASAISGQKEIGLRLEIDRGLGGRLLHCRLQACGAGARGTLLVERLFDAEPDALVAVCGDFNAESRETPVRVLLAGEEIPAAAHWPRARSSFLSSMCPSAAATPFATPAAPSSSIVFSLHERSPPGTRIPSITTTPWPMKSSMPH